MENDERREYKRKGFEGSSNHQLQLKSPYGWMTIWSMDDWWWMKLNGDGIGWMIKIIETSKTSQKSWKLCGNSKSREKWKTWKLFMKMIENEMKFSVYFIFSSLNLLKIIIKLIYFCGFYCFFSNIFSFELERNWNGFMDTNTRNESFCDMNEIRWRIMETPVIIQQYNLVKVSS